MVETRLRENKVSFYGSNSTFYDYVSTAESSQGEADENESVMLQWSLGLTGTGLRHEQSYISLKSTPNKMQQLGANTGLILFFYYLMTLILRPLARHSFIMRSLKRFYYVR